MNSLQQTVAASVELYSFVCFREPNGIINEVVFARRLSMVQICQSSLYKFGITLRGYSMSVLVPERPVKVVEDQYLHIMVDPL